MQLKSVSVENYKNIESSNEFNVDQVTCLVGKNESGKSALLQALYKLNPVETDLVFHDLQDYPRRHLSDYEEHKAEEPANVLTTIWELSDADCGKLEEAFGAGALNDRIVTIRKGYDNQRYWHFSLSEKFILSHFLSDVDLSSAELSELESVETISAAIELLTSHESPSAQQTLLLDLLENKFPGGDVQRGAAAVLEPSLPVFLYFSSYQRMPGQVAINDLLEKKSKKGLNLSEKIFMALLSLAGVSAEGIQELGFFEQLIAKLEAVSNRLTKEIFDFWSQNKHLEVEFRFDMGRANDLFPYNDGYVFRTRIKNRKYGVTINFDERSNGFVWFFSFLVWFSQVRRNYGENLVILLDEPGLNLHAKAQKDLIKYINEKLKPFHQVIYSTHSPFMVDAANLPSVRVVEDSSEGGKAVGSRVGEYTMSSDPDTLFPLQAALGYDMLGQLFVDRHTLIVDAPSDLLYLKWFSQELRTHGRESLDDRWVITPSGGLGKLASFITLFGTSSDQVVVLTGYHEGESNGSPMEIELLRKGRLFSPVTYLEQDEADLEDLLGRAFYMTLVNGCFELSKKNQITMAKAKSETSRVLSEVEQHFATLGPSSPTFDRYAPAAFLLSHSFELMDDLPDLDVVLDRFESLFADLNRLI